MSQVDFPRIVEYPELEEIHKGHQVQPPAQYNLKFNEL